MYTISATLIKWLVRGHANHLLRLLRELFTLLVKLSL